MSARTLQFARRVGHWVKLRLVDGTEVTGTISREGSTILWVGPIMVYKSLIVMAQHKDPLPTKED